MKKNYLILLILFAIGINCKAQDYQKDELLNTQWILTELIVDGKSYSPPLSPVHFEINKTSPIMNTEVCCNSLNGLVIFSDKENSFTVSSIDQTTDICLESDFGIRSPYFNFYSENPGTKVFNYQITWLLTDVKSLTIFSNNTTAHYQEQNLSKPKFSNNSLNINPNPANNSINISPDNINFDSSEIEIFDSLGKLCLKETFNQSTINIQNLKKGTYLIRIKKNNSIYTNKFIKN